MPLNVKFLVRIVPVPDMEQLLHNRAGTKFEHCAADHPEQEDQHQVIPHRNRDDQHDQCAEAVQRKHGPMHETPVYPAVLLQRYIYTFPDPAHKAVEEKD